ncbi:hypothetical protein D0S45_17365 [Marinifilum sp. JC120]|nr:hypothetical protein D0S45_17365 [Marinifilum sp. JC120]
MKIDLDRMTPEMEDVLVERLLGKFVKKLRERSKVLIPNGEIFQNADLCILDRGMIGQPTRDEIKVGWDEFNEASNSDEKIIALADVLRGHEAVILGRDK